MILSVHQPHYLPWIGYIDKIFKSDVFVFLNNVQYKKREFQNRNKIRIKTGWLWLTVPVISKDKYLQRLSDVDVNNETDWVNEHWKSIEHNYSHAKYFPAFRNRFADVYQHTWQRLVDVNVRLIEIFNDIYGVRTPVHFESNLDIRTTSTQRIIDICKKLNADTYLSGTGGKDYMDESLFAANGIRLVYQEFKHPVYGQVFEGFEPCMSIIDHLFNCGPDLWPQ
jgi:hypothetical protein